MVLMSAFVLVQILIWMGSPRSITTWRARPISACSTTSSIVVGLLPGVAAVLTGYAERLALKAQARQYDRMRALFERAYDLLPAEIDDHTTGFAHRLYQNSAWRR